ncbi:hypothetical protein CSB93_3941 [Pseudomonas paraeruginosa]|uniref:Uncharacterized protein n=1 Tax=Pseudomonas paraeruginosa TaxID=2994495 RepID=A0A2R3J0Q8_9PSED|nr:hypothetical protein CSB93_3941 [Pseudomonas paraeruginosa]AWE90039.1 hypothetical protein CSC28_2723 [Pseudomonas paraeruginosa]
MKQPAALCPCEANDRQAEVDAVLAVNVRPFDIHGVPSVHRARSFGSQQHRNH